MQQPCSNPSEDSEILGKLFSHRISLFAGILQTLETFCQVLYFLDAEEASGSNPLSLTLKTLQFAGKTQSKDEGHGGHPRPSCSTRARLQGSLSSLWLSTLSASISCSNRATLLNVQRKRFGRPQAGRRALSGSIRRCRPARSRSLT